MLCQDFIADLSCSLHRQKAVHGDVVSGSKTACTRARAFQNRLILFVRAALSACGVECARACWSLCLRPVTAVKGITHSLKQQTALMAAAAQILDVRQGEVGLCLVENGEVTLCVCVCVCVRARARAGVEV